MRLESKRGQHIRALTLVFVKFVAYFNITTYLFYFIRPLFQTIHIKLSILYYNSIFFFFGVILQFIKIIFLYHFFNHSLNSYISLFPQPIFLNLPPPPTKPSQRAQSNTKNKTCTFYHQFLQTHKIPPSLNINSSKPTKFSNTQINVKCPNQI